MPFRPERAELFPIIPENVPHFCHSDGRVSGVEESTTLLKEPTQDKACYSGRFLGSLRSLGMTCRGAVPFCPHGLYSKRPPPFCHSDRSTSGVEESTMLAKEPTQAKACNLSRFLGSLRSLGMTCWGAVPFCPHGFYLQRYMAMNHRRYIVWYRSTARVIFGT